MTNEQAEKLGGIVEKADNLLGATNLPLPPQVHINGLKSGLGEVRKIAHALYVELVGNDPWSDR